MRRPKRKWPLRSSTGPSSRRSLLRGPTGSSDCSSTWSMKMWADFSFLLVDVLLADLIFNVGFSCSSSHIASFSVQPGDRTPRCVHCCLSSWRNAGLVSNCSLALLTGPSGRDTIWRAAGSGREVYIKMRQKMWHSYCFVRFQVFSLRFKFQVFFASVIKNNKEIDGGGGCTIRFDWCVKSSEGKVYSTVFSAYLVK